MTDRVCNSPEASSEMDSEGSGVALAKLKVRLGPLPARPKISVLITNYNYEEYLPRALGSVLSQSWYPLEVIVSDDGSEDRSCELVTGYKERGLPVTLVRGMHRGMAGCLNAAFGESTGEIVCLLDADDYFVAGKLAAVVAAFRSSPDSGFCIHRTQRVDEKGRLSGVFPLMQGLPAGDQARATIGNSGVLMGLPPTSALSLRREVAERIFPIAEHYVGYAEQSIHRLAPLMTSVCIVDRALSSWTLHRRNDANASRVKVERLQRELGVMESLWRDQHRFLSVRSQSLAADLKPLQYNALYAKMRYVVGRLTADAEASRSHEILCGLPEIRHSYKGLYWRYSKRLPNSMFRKSVDLLETQGTLKHFLGRLLGRESQAI